MRALWFLIAAAPVVCAVSPRPTWLEVAPANPLLFGRDASQRLSVIAHYADGSARDVTALAKYASSRPAVATVQAAVVRAVGNGGARITVSF